MVEFRSADWAEKYFSAQSGRTSSWVTLSPSYTTQFSSWIDQVAWLVQREDCRGKFQRKIFNEAEEIASHNMALGTTILPSIFSADLSNVYRKVLYLMYAISTLLLICKSSLHGPRNYVDRMWERSVNLIQCTHLFLLVLSRQIKNPLIIWLSTVLGVNSRMTSKR